MRFDQETGRFFPEGEEVRLLGRDTPVELDLAMDLVLYLRQMRANIIRNDLSINAMDDPGELQAVPDQHVQDLALIDGMDGTIMAHLPAAIVAELEN